MWSMHSCYDIRATTQVWSCNVSVFAVSFQGRPCLALNTRNSFFSSSSLFQFCSKQTELVGKFNRSSAEFGSSIESLPKKADFAEDVIVRMFEQLNALKLIETEIAPLYVSAGRQAIQPTPLNCYCFLNCHDRSNNVVWVQDSILC